MGHPRPSSLWEARALGGLRGQQGHGRAERLWRSLPTQAGKQPQPPRDTLRRPRGTFPSVLKWGLELKARARAKERSQPSSCQLPLPRVRKQPQRQRPQSATGRASGASPGARAGRPDQRLQSGAVGTRRSLSSAGGRGGLRGTTGRRASRDLAAHPSRPCSPRGGCWSRTGRVGGGLGAPEVESCIGHGNQCHFSEEVGRVVGKSGKEKTKANPLTSPRGHGGNGAGPASPTEVTGGAGGTQWPYGCCVQPGDAFSERQPRVWLPGGPGVMTASLR